MLVKISFTDDALRTPINLAVIDDLLKAIDSASHNLKLRYGIILSVAVRHHCENSIIVSLESEFQDVNEFTIDNVCYGLKGIASYLLHKSRNKDLYAKCTVGKRLLFFTIIPSTDTNDKLTALEARNMADSVNMELKKTEQKRINDKILDASKNGLYSCRISRNTSKCILNDLTNMGYSIDKVTLENPKFLHSPEDYFYIVSWEKGCG